jgi:GNAT superfamily N-acetyltransferase
MASTDVLDIAPIAPDQSELVWPLSIEAGWNQNVRDWRFMLEAGRGFGCRGADGRWEASSLVLPVGSALSWISMVLVTRARRRAGLGTMLLKRCIEEVRAAGAVAGLDATEQGRPLYLTLGFHDLYAIKRWHLEAVSEAVAPSSGIRLRPVARRDMAELARYDRPRSGMERPAMLAHLADRRSDLAWIAENAAGECVGFVLGREGRMASSIGPVVADGEAVALALIAHVANTASGPFILDVPEAHHAIGRWLERQGAVSPRAYMRMTLGEAEGLDDASRLFALAGPELG